jgi:hypothetical protein
MRQTHGQRDGEMERERERWIHELMTSWPLEYLQKDRGYALTFWR